MIYTVPFSAVAVTAAQDVFELVTPAAQRIAINKIILGQYTDFGDAQAEILSVEIHRGHTVSGSGGSAATPVRLHPWGGASVVTAEINNTTVANTGGTLVYSDTFNVAAGFFYDPPNNKQVDERIRVDGGSRLVVRITAPVDSITMNGTLIFEEIHL